MTPAVLCHRVAAAAMGFALFLGMASPATGANKPAPSPKDSRVRIVDYDPNDVIEVQTTLGVATHILLPGDEDYVAHGFGDGAAYILSKYPGHILLKPKAKQANTNLIYITRQRNYTFDLKYEDTRPDGGVYLVKIRVPGEEKAVADAQREKDAVDAALAKNDLAINWESYSMNGDASLAPEAAWDDGAQTWLRFAPGQDLPTVFFVDADGQEVIPNRHMEGPRTIVLERIAALWRLRLGNQVLDVHNDRPSQARELDTGTLSPSVVRVLRKDSGK